MELVAANQAEAGRPTEPPIARADLERELDRVTATVQAEQGAFGQQLNWLMLSQALLLNAYLLVLVLGWDTPLPAKRWLLAGLALFGVAVAVLIKLALRGSRDTLTAMRKQRDSLESDLQTAYGRAPVFGVPNFVTQALASAATRMLPAAFVAGWLVLSLYTVGAPLNGQTRVAAEDSRNANAPASSPRVPSKTAAVRGAPSHNAAPPADEAATSTEPAPPKRTSFKSRP